MQKPHIGFNEEGIVGRPLLYSTARCPQKQIYLRLQIHF